MAQPDLARDGGVDQRHVPRLALDRIGQDRAVDAQFGGPARRRLKRLRGRGDDMDDIARKPWIIGPGAAQSSRARCRKAACGSAMP